MSTRVRALTLCFYTLLLCACAFRQFSHAPENRIHGDWVCDADASWRQLYPDKPFAEDFIYHALKDGRVSIDVDEKTMTVDNASSPGVRAVVRYEVASVEGNKVTLVFQDFAGRRDVLELRDDATLIMYNEAVPNIKSFFRRAE